MIKQMYSYYNGFFENTEFITDLLTLIKSRDYFSADEIFV